MAHNRNDSLDSTAPLTSLTSISSRASVEIYESLKEEIAGIEQSQIDLQELVDAAEKIMKKFAPAPQSTYTYKKGSETISVKLDAVMSAMLACGDECGGQRYAASAIVACTQKENDQDVVETLAALGTTWLTHFLFVCQFYYADRYLAMNTGPDFPLVKTNRSHETQPNQEPYELATPTLQITTSHVGERGGDRSGSFSDDVRRYLLEKISLHELPNRGDRTRRIQVCCNGVSRFLSPCSG